MNRQTKRMLQRQGQVDQEGSPVVGTREPSRTAPSRRGAAGGGPRDVPTGGSAGARGPRGGAFQFVRDVRGELRRVAWGTRQEVVNYTSIVIVTLIVLVSFVFLLNLGFARVISALFGT